MILPLILLVAFAGDKYAISEEQMLELSDITNLVLEFDPVIPYLENDDLEVVLDDIVGTLEPFLSKEELTSRIAKLKKDWKSLERYDEALSKEKYI